MGNICRSPPGEAVLKAKVRQQGLNVEVDSAGTIGFHDGSPPDSRSEQTANRKGYSFKGIRSRKVVMQDFDEFDYIFAMDNPNKNNILALSTNKEDKNKVELFLNLSHPNKNINVPDPYYGGEEGFEDVYQMLNFACDIFLNNLKNE